jgi:ATP-dependent DNA helicase DinG
MTLANKRFTENCIQELKAEIEEAQGNEVFALGFLDDKGVVCRVRVTARGNEGAVLALQPEDWDQGDAYADDEPQASADVLIHNHPSGFLVPSDEDLAIAGRAAESGVGAFIVDNDVARVYVIAEPVKRKKIKKIDAQEISRALQEGGVIASRLEVYEPRQSQLELLELIVRSFNEDAIAAAEAGTGVGKSFAYLLPALHFALANNERIVISTATITLQQQLYEKDIPLVAQSMKSKIKTVLMKGRGNYICLRRLEDSLREPDLDEAEREELHRIAAWVEASKTGSRSDLSFLPSESLWGRLCSEADLCLGMKCRERERCFVMALRKEASDARIIVANHHLLFADLAARQEGAGYDSTIVLPPYSRVIVDEAHTIEQAATSFFSKEFSRLSVMRQLGRLFRRRRAARQGLLVRLGALLHTDDSYDGVVSAIDAVRKAAEELDQPALEICGGEGVFRLSPYQDNSGAEPALFPLLGTLRKKILALNGEIRKLLEQVPEDAQEGQVVWETKAIVRRLDDIASICAAFPDYRERADEVIWVEKRRSHDGDPWAVFNQAPVNVAQNLKDSLFAPNKTVVCVSATLTVNGTFDYWANRNGLALVSDKPVFSGCFPSPFPYSRSVLLATPASAPLPEEDGYQEFIDHAVGELAASSGGSALILFTSYQSLHSAYEAAVPLLSSLGIRCLKQGDDDRSRLLQNFLADESSVLFATDSFWEGVDAPGNTLRLVILCRLPFKSPNDPVFEARREAIEKHGGNPFMELSLPSAVMKFKQGFGRLMRRSSDHGVVAVLDGRIIKKRYGSMFLNSLPETRTSFADFKDILRDIENFLFSARIL